MMGASLVSSLLLLSLWKQCCNASNLFLYGGLVAECCPRLIELCSRVVWSHAPICLSACIIEPICSGYVFLSLRGRSECKVHFIFDPVNGVINQFVDMIMKDFQEIKVARFIATSPKDLPPIRCFLATFLKLRICLAKRRIWTADLPIAEPLWNH